MCIRDRNNTYPLSVSAERSIQAVEIINYAKKINADFVAHGSTGAGNDQVRFDLIFQTLAPEIKILTPIRDQHLTRQEEIQFLLANGIELTWSKAKYSINKECILDTFRNYNCRSYPRYL